MIKHIDGDATNPIKTGGPLVIVHCCNNIDVWGAGFVIALSKRFGRKGDRSPEARYHEWFATGNRVNPSPMSNTLAPHPGKELPLGQVQFVEVDDNLWVANLIGQEGVGTDAAGHPPVRYEAIKEGMKTIRDFLEHIEGDMVCPMFGAGLAGGNWETIEDIITEELDSAGIDCHVYTYAPVAA